MQLRFNSGGSTSGSTRRETEDGIEYLVAEATIAREGVLDYSDQRNAFDHELLPKEEFTPASRWNGLPVLVDHPTTATAGTVQPASTTTPGVSTTDVGDFRDAGTSSDGASLGGEVWIRASERDQHGPGFKRAFDALEDEDEVAVSPGYGVGRLDESGGRHNGQNYSGIQRDLDPDHVAVVINGKARCSIEAGCSIGERANAQPDGGTDTTPQAAFGTPLNRSENDAMTTRQNAESKTVAGVTFTGKSGGKLDESAIDEDDFEGHYLYPGDSKSESSYPVVDGSDALRKGNVSSAHSVGARGGVDADDLESKLKALNKQWPEGERPIDFDNDRENALQRAHTALGEARNAIGSFMRGNQQTSDRVKWESESGDTRYGIVVDQLDGDDQPDEKVLVSMYEHIGDSGESSSSEKSDWQNMTDEDGNDQNARVDSEELTTIEQFPSSPSRGNAENSAIDEPADTGSGSGTGGREQPRGDSNDTQETMSSPDTDDPDDEQMIDYLVSEDGPNLDRENMAPLEGEECLGEIYQRFNASAEDETESDSNEDENPDESSPDTTENGGSSDDDDTPTIEMTEAEFEKKLTETVDERIEERQNSKDRAALTDSITANSEYDTEDLDGMAMSGLMKTYEREVPRQNAAVEGADPSWSDDPPQAQADRSAMQTGGPVRDNAENTEPPEVSVGSPEAWSEANGQESDD